MIPLAPACAVPDEGSLSRRRFDEPAQPYRTPFARDRARVIHSRAFRRLAGKTQVFTERYSDHFRSRLTHTMEVAQIARSIAVALGLNQDLTETLALVHDIGHPPFGHAGERALDEAMRQYGLRFDHNLHALRIVDHFEVRYLDFRGLNLTLGVREGIIKHSRDYSATDHPELSEFFLDLYPPLEAQIIDLADEIAYLTADLDDGMEAGMLSLQQVRGGVELFERYYAPLEREHPEARSQLRFNEALRRMLHALVTDLIEHTALQVRERGLNSLDDIRHAPGRICQFSPAMESLRMATKRFLYENLYLSPDLSWAHQEASAVIHRLFAWWMEDPSRLPASHAALVPETSAARVVADYIAGMTDAYILQLDHDLTGETRLHPGPASN
ncbi:MAG: dGTP triphosphohydrolase [Acidobacteriaceae bacterium]